jgi:hypothetical protein
MRSPVLAGVAIAALSVGVGLAASRSTEEPMHVPNPAAEEVMLADRFGNALRCRGRFVLVRRSDLGGSVPTMTPDQAVQSQTRARLGYPVATGRISPSFEGFSCAKNARGVETGDVVAHVTEPSGRASMRTLESTSD